VPWVTRTDTQEDDIMRNGELEATLTPVRRRTNYKPAQEGSIAVRASLDDT
jgi:hypothetical protein